MPATSSSEVGECWGVNGSQLVGWKYNEFSASAGYRLPVTIRGPLNSQDEDGANLQVNI